MCRVIDNQYYLLSYKKTLLDQSILANEITNPDLDIIPGEYNINNRWLKGYTVLKETHKHPISKRIRVHMQWKHVSG